MNDSPYRNNINRCDWMYSDYSQCPKKIIEKVGDHWYCSRHAMFAKMILSREQQRAAHAAPKP